LIENREDQQDIEEAQRALANARAKRKETITWEKARKNLAVKAAR
jgi:hypothetical protein